MRTFLKPATCKSRYIPADALEDIVWRRVSDALCEPGVLINQLREYLSTGGGDIGKKIDRLRRTIRELRGQMNRLVEMRQKDAIPLDLLEGKIGPVKTLCDQKETELRELEDQQKLEADSVETEHRIRELCGEFAAKLATLDYDGKRSTLAAFGIKVEATREELLTTLVVGPKFTTIARTSA